MSNLKVVSERVLKVLDSEPKLLVDWINELKQAREELRQALAQPEYGPMLGAQIASEDWIKALERGMVTGAKKDHRDKDIADLTKACQVLLRENRRLQEALDK
jgi:hypothetical protein